MRENAGMCWESASREHANPKRLHFHPRAAAEPQTDPKLTVYLSRCEIKASAQRRASLDRISATSHVKDAAVHP